MSNFILIGDGSIARYHRKAIEHVGGRLAYVYDPEYRGLNIWKGVPVAGYNELPELVGKLWDLDMEIYVVIASPSHFHREQIKFVLENFPASTKIICEKPAFLPWEIPIDNDRINICLQLQYAPILSLLKPNLIRVRFVRDDAYFKSWKGDPKKTGGLFYNLFVHYLNLAQLFDCDFEGTVATSGEQYRYVYEGIAPVVNLQAINMQNCYDLMYEAILAGNGIKPKDLFYLDWILKRNSEIFGYGKNSINKTIKIGHELL